MRRTLECNWESRTSGTRMNVLRWACSEVIRCVVTTLTSLVAGGSGVMRTCSDADLGAGK